MKLAIFCFFLLVLVTTESLACALLPHDPTWREILSKAEGAVLVHPTKLVDVNEKVIVDLALKEKLRDDRLLFRGKTILATEIGSTQSDWHQKLGFWMGRQTAEIRSPFTCRAEQSVDFSKDYVLLLSVDGPFTLEPVVGAEDPWLRAVREYFSNKNREIPTITIDDFEHQIKPLALGSCDFEKNPFSRSADLSECLFKKSRFDQYLLVEINGTWREQLRLDPVTMRVTSNALKEVFGTNLGREDGILISKLLKD